MHSLASCCGGEPSIKFAPNFDVCERQRSRSKSSDTVIDTNMMKVMNLGDDRACLGALMR